MLGDKMVFNSFKKRIDPYLAPGEELLSVTPVQGAGMMKGYFLAGEVGVAIKGARRDKAARESEASGANEGGVTLASTNMTLAITSRRLLIFKFGKGRGANPKYLLTDLPIGEVDSIQVGSSSGKLTKPVTLTVGGEVFQLEARKAVNGATLTSSFDQAKSGDHSQFSAVAAGNPAVPARSPEAAWCPDPTTRHQLRYWDGQDWTAYVADQGTQSTDPVKTP